jgi:HPt (histidine-containing phosphotransfer) domain-containing protein
MEGRTRLDSDHENNKAYDLNDLINLSRGDIQVYNKTLQSFFRTVESVRLHIEKHLKEEQWHELGEQSHKLISSTRFLGMSEIANLCLQIEDNTIKSDNHQMVPGLVENLFEKMDGVLPLLKNEYIGEKS